MSRQSDDYDDFLDAMSERAEAHGEHLAMLDDQKAIDKAKTEQPQWKMPSFGWSDGWMKVDDGLSFLAFALQEIQTKVRVGENAKTPETTAICSLVDQAEHLLWEAQQAWQKLYPVPVSEDSEPF